VLIADYPFASVDIETGILAQDGVEVVAAQCVTDEEAVRLRLVNRTTAAAE
jgi:hypothetical protein